MNYIVYKRQLLTYFQFLIRVCYRPFLKDAIKAKGITFKMPDKETLYLKRDNPKFFLTRNGFLYHNRIAKLCIDNCVDSIRERIDKYYDYFMIDEVQDLGGHDFNLVQAIMPLKNDCLFVGDFYQHTYDTSKDGNVNSKLYDDYVKYIQRWRKIDFTVDEDCLSNSYRCSPTTCCFISQKLGIVIHSHRQDKTKIIFVDTKAAADILYNDDEKIKLFYEDAFKYNCSSLNWGASKGIDKFVDICIILNASTLSAYMEGHLNSIAPATLHKLYVACTRARGDIYFIPHKFIDKYKNQSK